MVRRKHNIPDPTRRRQGRLWRIGIACLISVGVVMLIAQVSKDPVRYHTARSDAPKKAAAEQPSLPKAVNYGLPVRLKIPRLAIDAPITYMGLTKTGEMASPTKITDVGWYKNGSLPGNQGSAVLAGHVDGKGGQVGVFAGLDKLQKGDILEVIDSNGAVISFTVKETRTYSQDAQAKEVFDTAGSARLNLITCTGTWDNAQRRFLERLVVFTDKSS